MHMDRNPESCYLTATKPPASPKYSGEGEGTLDAQQLAWSIHPGRPYTRMLGAAISR
jgi:hypothetical protein